MVLLTGEVESGSDHLNRQDKASIALLRGFRTSIGKCFPAVQIRSPTYIDYSRQIIRHLRPQTDKPVRHA